MDTPDPNDLRAERRVTVAVGGTGTERREFQVPAGLVGEAIEALARLEGGESIDGDPHLTVNQAAERTGLRADYVAALVERNEIPSAAMDGGRTVRRSDVDAWNRVRIARAGRAAAALSAVAEE